MSFLRVNKAFWQLGAATPRLWLCSAPVPIQKAPTKLNQYCCWHQGLQAQKGNERTAPDCCELGICVKNRPFTLIFHVARGAQARPFFVWRNIAPMWPTSQGSPSHVANFHSETTDRGLASSAWGHRGWECSYWI
jgi:hypothetical protein